MNTDINKQQRTTNAEMILANLDSSIVLEAVEYRFKKSRGKTVLAVCAACFLLTVAAAAILHRWASDNSDQSALLPNENVSFSAHHTDAAATPVITPVPTPDISGMRIIYANNDPGIAVIDDMLHALGRCHFYGSIASMLDDERYRDCVFAVNIDLEGFERVIWKKHEKELDQLYVNEYQNAPAIVLYTTLYDEFVEKNRERYIEFLVKYYIGDGVEYTDAELDLLADKYDETMVFPVAFSHYLESIDRGDVLSEYVKAKDEYYVKRSALYKDQDNRPDEKAYIRSRYDAEIQRLKDCGFIAEPYELYGVERLRWLLTPDQLKNFPADPECAYIIWLAGETASIDE